MSASTKDTALEATQFITSNSYGMLSTISASQNGFPFGSIVPYDLTSNGEVIIYVSFLAEHYKNLSADPRASLLVVSQFGEKDPQAHGRATILCRFSAVSKEDAQEVQKSYEAKFPNSINYEIAHNFTFMRGIPEKIRWIGGFGKIAWVSGENYRAAL